MRELAQQRVRDDTMTAVWRDRGRRYDGHLPGAALTVFAVALAVISLAPAGLHGQTLPRTGLPVSESVFSVATTPDGGVLVGGDGFVARAEAAAATWDIVLRVARTGSDPAAGLGGEGATTDSREELVEDRAEEILEQLVEDEREEIISSLEDELGFEPDPADVDGFVDDQLEDRLPELEREARERAESEIDAPAGDGAPAGGRRDAIVWQIAVAPDGETVAAATDAGAFISRNGGRDWREMTLGSTTTGAGVRSVAFADGQLYLGTSEGLFIATDELVEARRASSPVVNASLGFIRACHGELFAVGRTTLFVGRTNAGHERDWEIVYLPETSGAGAARFVACGDDATREVVVATSNGALSYRDADRRWQRLPESGLGSRDIFSLLRSRRGWLAATAAGVYALEEGGWRTLTGTSNNLEVRWLAISEWGTLLLATELGVRETLLTAVVGPEGEATAESILARFDEESTPQQLARRSLRGFGIAPDQDVRWRPQRALRWILPDSVRFDLRVAIADDDDVATTSTRGVIDRRVRATSLRNEPVQYRVFATWDLAEAWRERHDRAIQDEVSDRRDDERRIAARIADLDLRRRRIAVGAAGGADAPTRVRVRQHLEFAAATAEINALTGAGLEVDLGRFLASRQNAGTESVLATRRSARDFGEAAVISPDGAAAER